MSNLKIKGHTSPGMRKRNVREDYGRKKQAHFKVSKRHDRYPLSDSLLRTAATEEKDGCGVCNGQGQSGKFNETANRFGHGAAGQGQKQSEVRRKLVPENEAGRSTRGGSRRKEAGGRGWRRAPNCGVSTVEGAWTPKIEGETEEKSVNWQGKGETETEKEREMV